MKTQILIAVLLGALFIGCSVSHIITDDSNENYLPATEEMVEVYSTDKIDKEYVIIGEVLSSVESFNEAESAVRQLRKRAAKLGADGIINLRLRLTEGVLGEAVHAKGTAIKYVNL